MYHVHKLRDKLGWKTEIPRHAPGCKEAMETLKNIPNNEKVHTTFHCTYHFSTHGYI